MIHIRDEGDERPIVLLHGMGASARVFDPLSANPKGRVIAVYLPRTARSGPWAKSTPHHIAEELLKVLDARRVSAFELFGHSFGGLVALQLSALVPRRLTRLTVASVPALGVPPEFKLLLSNPLADLTMGWFGRMPVWRPALRSYLSMIWGDGRKISEAHLSLYEEAITAPGFSDGMLEALRAVGSYKLPYEVLRTLDVPRRVIWGDKDRLVSVIQGEQLARALGAELSVLNDVGHCVPEEAPEGMSSLVPG